MSIQPNELRIGNWVQSPLGDYMKVEIIGHADMPDYIFAKSETGFGQNKFEPIPITPEILLACGFKPPEEKRNGFKLILDLPDNNEIEYGWASGNDFCLNGMFLPVYPKCIHQLQNLYFALTGNELNINL